MNIYSTLVFLHVTTAIFGLGPLPVLAVVSSGARGPLLPWDRFSRLFIFVGWSLLVMFATGAAIIALTHGALGETRWMRVSFALFLVLGALHGAGRRQLRKFRGDTSEAMSAKFLTRILWSMCGVTAAITYLMEAKPW